jgi:hypothetical protein
MLNIYFGLCDCAMIGSYFLSTQYLCSVVQFNISITKNKDNNVIANIPKSLDGIFYAILNFDEIINVNWKFKWFTINNYKYLLLIILFIKICNIYIYILYNIIIYYY